jgi:hypothetical protein
LHPVLLHRQRCPPRPLQWLHRPTPC